jgi:sugar porter (SP) family MFS transporter
MSTISKPLYQNDSDKGSIFYVYFVSTVAAVGGLLFGFDTGVISGAIPFVTKHFNLNSVQEGFTVSNLVIGCIIGASSAGILSDRFGRKPVLISSALLFTLSAVLSAVPRTILELIIARFIGGIAVGIASVISPLYIAEISPARIRGALVSLNQFTIVLGILLTYFTNWLVVDIGPNNWRWMFGLETIPAGLFFLILFFIPESPRWLTKRDKRDQALLVLTKVGGSKHAEIELEEIQASIQSEEGSVLELFKPGLRKVIFVSIILAIFSQITGIDSIVYYAPKVFIKAGYESASSAFIASIMVALTLLIFTILAIFTVDKYGRKPLLLIGSLGMGISFASTGYIFQQHNATALWILLPIIIYIAFFAMSYGAVVWVIIAEVFPNKIRGAAVSIATMALWLANFVVAQTFPWLVETIGGRIYYMFSVICFISFIFIWLMVTETKGKSLEEIEKMWRQ